VFHVVVAVRVKDPATFRVTGLEPEPVKKVTVPVETVRFAQFIVWLIWEEFPIVTVYVPA